MPTIFARLFVTALSILSVSAYAQSQSDRDAIDALLRMHTEKWNVHDMDAWADILHDDADWVHWRGGIWRGKQQIRDGHKEIHRTYYKAPRMSPQRIEDLTFIAPEMALAHVRSELTGDERAPGQTFQYRKTIVFTKKMVNGESGRCTTRGFSHAPCPLLAGGGLLLPTHSGHLSPHLG